MMFLDCPAYLDQDGATRCGLPAEVTCRFIMRSTDGPLESAMIRCPAGHWFNGPIEFLTWDRTDKRDPGTAAVASGARRDSLAGSHDGPDRGDGPAVREIPAERARDIPRPASAPAYYLGRCARVWITAMRSDDNQRYPSTAASPAAGHQAPQSQRKREGSADSHPLPRMPGQPERTAMPVPERRS